MNNLDDDFQLIQHSDGSNTLIFDPYNPLNIQIQTENIQTILRTYGIPTDIYNFNLYKRAFIHRSYIKRPALDNIQHNIHIVPQPENCLSLFSKSNERLEFLGDGILDAITKLYLYKRFPKENEGFMTEKKIALVKNESIGKIALEMGLHKWFILSKHAELKQTRTNLKKLGCLFEAFVGAIFLDFNKIQIHDSENWFSDLFVTGPGFQMAQIFIENVFEKHVDWIELIKNDDNYKNILQVKIQKEFKVTPYYLEMTEHNQETGYHMGVYLCLGQYIHNVAIQDAIPIEHFKSYNEIHEYMSSHNKVLIFLGEGVHKIKKKGEQIACEHAIHYLKDFSV
jgi:dsRNA-specific ribonuclease